MTDFEEVDTMRHALIDAHYFLGELKKREAGTAADVRTDLEPLLAAQNRTLDRIVLFVEDLSRRLDAIERKMG